MRPTRRAYVVITVVAGGLAAGTLFGARALDAVVLPAAVALLGAAVQVWRAPTPTVERTLPAAETAGTTGTVELSLRASQSYPVTIRDRLPPGIRGPAEATTSNRRSDDPTAASEAVVEATVGGDASYEITPRRRGEHEIGPATVVVSDVLGLAKRSIRVDVRDALLVFPPVRRLSGSARADLRAACETRSRRTASRDAFDGLREYVRGDARRDIHWKSSAKRGELVVQEFVAERESERVVVAAGTEPAADGAAESAAGGRSESSADGDAETVDAMAEAAATVCLSLARDGRPVTLATAAGSVEASQGATRPLLEHLATVEGGPVPTTEADIVIRAANGSASVRFGDRERPFEALTVGAGESDGTVVGRKTTARDAGTAARKSESTAEATEPTGTSETAGTPEASETAESREAPR